MDDNLGGYDLAGKGNIRLGSADNSAFLVLIIILFFGYYVNRAHDVAVASVGQKNSAIEWKHPIAEKRLFNRFLFYFLSITL